MKEQAMSMNDIKKQNSLDKSEAIKKIDPLGMYEKIYFFPEQLETAAEIGDSINLDPKQYDSIKNITVAGMGGSAIGGDLVRSYLADKIEIPFFICRNYHLPKFVDKNSLVIVSSYSGNTEETNSALSEAVERGCKVICITTGGEVARVAENNNFPVVRLPGGYPPRAALGLSFVPLLFLISKLGIINQVNDDINQLISSLKLWRMLYDTATPTDQNETKKLALKLFGKIPIIYSGPELTDAVATRWKGQICENAKCLAFNNQFPEFNHNELVGWEIIAPYRDKLVVINLKSSDDDKRVSLRMEIVREIIKKQKVELIDIDSKGDSVLQRIFSLIQIGDFTSFYLAILNNVDPTPVKAIDYLKGKLSEA